MQYLLSPRVKWKPLYAGPFLADLMANQMSLRGANGGINGRMQLCLGLWKIRNTFWFPYNRNEIVCQLPNIFFVAQVSNHLVNVDTFSLSGKSIWCLSEDMLGYQKQDVHAQIPYKTNKSQFCQFNDEKLRPKIMPLIRSHRTKLWYQRPFLVNLMADLVSLLSGAILAWMDKMQLWYRLLKSWHVLLLLSNIIKIIKHLSKHSSPTWLSKSLVNVDKFELICKINLVPDWGHILSWKDIV